VARAIHYYSQSSGSVTLRAECAGVPCTRLERQLFGRRRGASTGAVTAQEGLFARARGGTIFLDDIGDLPTGLQSKLLRAIEAKEILPVGSTHPSP
jgi:transcriptional regulator with PAS, ATPase and Fis domain